MRRHHHHHHDEDNQRAADEEQRWTADLGLSSVLKDTTSVRDVVLSRLRLRFGSPCTLTIERPFTLVVDLVDEMAQSLAVHSLPPTVSVVVLTEGSDRQTLEPATELAVETLRCSPRPNAAQWRLDCVLHRLPTSPSRSLDRRLASIRLQIALSTPSPSPSLVSPSHAVLDAIQRFCVDSQWLPLRRGGRTLVLPVVSDAILIHDSLSSSQPPPAAPSSSSSSRCLRRFQVSSKGIHLCIQEDYGLAMGAHVWDASIWLSVTLLMAAQAPSQSLPNMLELGAGTGLLGCVYHALCKSQEPSKTASAMSMVLTERPDCVETLQANLRRNAVVDAVALPLVWGADAAAAALATLEDRVDVVFAADVLYHWSVHELWLATVEQLYTQRQQHSERRSAFRVLLAHKRRGEATSERLDAVLRDGIDAACGTRCQWRHWDVRRIGAVSAIDVLQLTPRDSLATDDSH